MRKTAGYSQQDIADQLPNTTQGAVSQWEQGLSYPHPSKIPKLAELYGVTEGDIIAAVTEAKKAGA